MLYVTLRQMEYVAAVAEAGSLSAAAALLHVSQPALSVALAQVEARLGRALFLRRKGAPLVVTPFGATYVTEAEALLAQARRLEDPARLSRAVEGRLALGCFEDLAPRHLAPMLARLRAGLPGVDLRWMVASFETLARDMAEGRLDLVLAYDLGLDAGFERDTVAWAAPHAFMAPGHALAGLAAVTLADLAREALILLEEGLSIRHVLHLFRAVGATPRVAHRVRSLEVMRSLAAHGERMGVSYSAPPRGPVLRRPVAAVRVADQMAREPIVLARLRAQGSVSATAALRLLREHLRTTTKA